MPAHRATPDDFWKRVEKTETCWLWRGAVKADGYGQIMRLRKSIYAHRYAYELERGPVPDGLGLDHLCRVRNCVNPDHLEPVTTAENLHRGEGVAGRNFRKTQCSRGHLYDLLNTRWYKGERNCRACDRLRPHRRPAPRLTCMHCGRDFRGGQGRARHELFCQVAA